MRAIICEEFGPPERLREVDVPMPEPGPGQVRVKVAATGLGFVDGLLIQGLYQVKPPLPYFPGNEFAGTIDAVGDGVEGMAVGDRVFGMVMAGALSDYVISMPGMCFKTPDTLSDAQAASLYINYLTAIYGLRDCGKLQEGETLLVLGAAGGVGSAAIAVAKSMGATVIGAASSEAKRNVALAAGADAVIDYTQDDWRTTLKTLAPQGINLVYDPVGGDISETAFRTLSPGGRFLVVGFAAGSIPKLPFNLALLKRSSLVGVDWGGEMRANPAVVMGQTKTLLKGLADGSITPAPISERPASDYVKAFEDQLAGKITGKLVLTR